jgi:hypothetical protein
MRDFAVAKDRGCGGCVAVTAVREPLDWRDFEFFVEVELAEEEFERARIGGPHDGVFTP